MQIRMTDARKDALIRVGLFGVVTAPLFFVALPIMTWIGIGVALLMLPFKYFFDMGWMSLEAMMKPVNALSKAGSFIFSHLKAFAWVLNVLCVTPLVFYVFDLLSPFKSPFKGHWYGPLSFFEDLFVIFDFRSPKTAGNDLSLSEKTEETTTLDPEVSNGMTLCNAYGDDSEVGQTVTLAFNGQIRKPLYPIIEESSESTTAQFFSEAVNYNEGAPSQTTGL